MILLIVPAGFMGFIRQSALNVKVVRAGQISRIVGISAGGSTFRFMSKTTRFRP